VGEANLSNDRCEGFLTDSVEGGTGVCEKIFGSFLEYVQKAKEFSECCGNCKGIWGCATCLFRHQCELRNECLLTSCGFGTLNLEEISSPLTVETPSSQPGSSQKSENSVSTPSQSLSQALAAQSPSVSSLQSPIKSSGERVPLAKIDLNSSINMDDLEFRILQREREILEREKKLLEMEKKYLNLQKMKTQSTQPY